VRCLPAGFRPRPSPGSSSRAASMTSFDQHLTSAFNLPGCLNDFAPTTLPWPFSPISLEYAAIGIACS
jgi:hypothetical protein